MTDIFAAILASPGDRRRKRNVDHKHRRKRRSRRHGYPVDGEHEEGNHRRHRRRAIRDRDPRGRRRHSADFPARDPYSWKQRPMAAAQLYGAYREPLKDPDPAIWPATPPEMHSQPKFDRHQGARQARYPEQPDPWYPQYPTPPLTDSDWDVVENPNLNPNQARRARRRDKAGPPHPTVASGSGSEPAAWPPEVVNEGNNEPMLSPRMGPGQSEHGIPFDGYPRPPQQFRDSPPTAIPPVPRRRRRRKRPGMEDPYFIPPMDNPGNDAGDAFMHPPVDPSLAERQQAPVGGADVLGGAGQVRQRRRRDIPMMSGGLRPRRREGERRLST